MRPTGLTGRCLCGPVTYKADSAPLWVTVCHCRFCQRATGSDRMIQPVFEKLGFRFSGARPSIYSQPSDGSGKLINVHFCPGCGTKLALTFQRWPDKIGLYIGTLDTPSAIAFGPDGSKHIFVSEALPGTLLPPWVKTFDRHAADSEGNPITPTIHDAPFATV